MANVKKQELAFLFQHLRIPTMANNLMLKCFKPAHAPRLTVLRRRSNHVLQMFPFGTLACFVYLPRSEPHSHFSFVKYPAKGHVADLEGRWSGAFIKDTRLTSLWCRLSLESIPAQSRL